LSEAELTEAVEVGPEAGRALWIASGGLPGAAFALLPRLADVPGGVDPLVHLALNARPATRFLDVDVTVARLLEAGIEQAAGDAERAVLQARLACELLGDTAAGERRKDLIESSLAAARRCGDRRVLAEVIDARLHALWDPAGTGDRLDAAAEIVALARACGDAKRERSGLFWRFVALMELGRVAEAESALAGFERSARTAGDAEALVMATSRHAMLATFHGRFDEAARLIGEVEELGSRAGVTDTVALAGTLRGTIAMLREDRAVGEAAVGIMYDAARHAPGHLFEASAARVLAMMGRHAQASAELERLLPRAVAASGPRWLGAMADLSAAAVATEHAAARELYAAMLPYRGQLVVWGGANTVTGPVSHYLGLLATALGRLDDAVDLLDEAIGLEERCGALPWLALSLSALAATLTSRQRLGDEPRAADCRQRARQLAERLDMPVQGRQLRAPNEWALRRDGDDWILEAGEERARLRDSLGLRHLRALLAAPRAEIPALDLAAGGAGLVASGSAPQLDPVALTAYRRRVSALDAELESADRAGNQVQAARAQTERDAILDELRRASGLGGRARNTSAEAERARVNVTRTLRAALGRLAATAPRAAAHLQASISTGVSCRYDPAAGGPVRWHV
jgi:tetratricopeptide (TPR) repeat protein